MLHALLDAYPWALPLAIFFGRICDVSLGTLRILFVSKGEKKIAPLIGFVEVFIWVVIIAQVLSRANDLLSFLSYAGGYATGTYIGLCIEERIGYGFAKYRVFTLLNGHELMALLNKDGFGSTMVHGEGSVSEIDIIETVINRRDAKKVESLIESFDPKAFCLVEDIRAKQLGIFAKRQSLLQRK
ncbi:conserved membrane hypothetical protein [uncultured delta proteobacterium]|uniref:UPF0316 protein KL86DPRO_11243 n=1 Tax=uncultured delta proteobacterium TaxID=34034 RepID=A0A212JDR0_9DELT|nr:conserved membrane hypothetical protein [uncultured delta proteobacterium]